MPTISFFPVLDLSFEWKILEAKIDTYSSNAENKVLYELHIFSNCGAIFWDFLELRMGKLNASAIYW